MAAIAPTLADLESAVAESDREQELALEALTVRPMNALQKTLSTVAGWLLQ